MQGEGQGGDNGGEKFSAEDLAHISTSGGADHAGGAADGKGEANAGSGKADAGAKADAGGDKGAADKGKTDAKSADAASAADKGAKPKDGADAGKDKAGAADAKADGNADAGSKSDGDAAGKDGKDAKAEGEEGADEVPIWPEQGFPDNWRERLIASLKLEGEALKKAEERAKRASNPGDLLRTVLAGDSKIHELDAEVKGRIKLPVGKADTPENAAAFDKQWGVPEKAEDYKLPERPQALGARTEEDLALLKEVKAFDRFKAAHYSQEQMKVAMELMDEAQLTMLKARADQSIAYDKAAEDDLRVTWVTPKDYNANFELANRFLQGWLGKYMPDAAERQQFLNLTFDNGRKLGSYTGFVKAVVDAARNGGFDPVGDDDIEDLTAGEQAGGKSLEERIKEITKLAHTGRPDDEKRYKELQPELLKLSRRLDERNQRARG